MFSKSKAITSPNVITIFELLLNLIITSIAALDNLSQVAVNGTQRSI